MRFINKNKSIVTHTLIYLISLLLSACGSDNDSKALAQAVFLESQRAQGTIIESVTIIGDQTRLKPGETHQLSASGIDSNGDQREITNELIWSSNDETIATVNNKGLVTAVASSSVNSGIVTIVGTTVNSIYGEGEISVSDAKVNGIILKQKTPESGNITTCIDASIHGDVSYEDGYLSLNTIKDMTFTLNEETNAIINENGILSTTSEFIENITVEAKIENVTDTLTVIADPTNLDEINALVDNKITTLIAMNVGERIQVNSQASITTDESEYDIDNNITWLTDEPGKIGITNNGDNKGSVFAIKPGIAQLSGACGNKSSNTVVDIKGNADLAEIIINDGASSITLVKNQSVDLILTANYTTEPASLNVSEFAAWNTFDSNLINTEFIYAGTNAVRYRVTNVSNEVGTAIILATYDNITARVDIIIE